MKKTKREIKKDERNTRGIKEKRGEKKEQKKNEGDKKE
jgi:hypothetical protein